MIGQTNGAQNASDAISTMVTMMQAPAQNGIAVSQRLALATTQYWARRMRAYADQIELLAGCSTANQIVAAQAQFIERMQEDIAVETAALTDIFQPPNGQH